MPTYQGFNSTCVGYSHIKDGSECQDYSGFFCGEGFAVAAAADGHGSEKYFRSGEGARIVVEAAIDSIKGFLSEKSENENLFKEKHTQILENLAGTIATRWVTGVEKHCQENLFNDSESELIRKYYNIDLESINEHVEDYSKLSFDNERTITRIYGTTLVVGVITDGFAFALNNGDGVVVLIDNEKKCSIPPETVNDQLFAGLTTSMSDIDVVKKSFKYYFTTDIPKAIFLSTDGVRDSYKLSGFFTLMSELLSLFEQDTEAAQKKLEEWLPKISEKGSEDDMSLAGIIKKA